MMTSDRFTDLRFEKSARKDPRMWLGLGIGGVLAVAAGNTTVRALLRSEFDGQFIAASLAFLFGAMFVVVSSFQLRHNSSRGCRVDPDTLELVCWNMKRPGSDAETRIKLADLDKIRIDTRGEGVDITAYRQSGDQYDAFSEAMLPPDYRTWAKRLNAHFPHVTIELKP